ncbi:hypothetical protein [Pectobacterium colocasium]
MEVEIAQRSAANNIVCGELVVLREGDKLIQSKNHKLTNGRFVFNVVVT